MTVRDKEEEQRIAKMFAKLEVPFEEAEFILTLEKPYYPVVLYYKTLEDAVSVYEYCEKKTTPTPVEMTMTISQIIRKRQSTDPWF